MLANTKNHNLYKSTQISTASSLKIIVLLYEGAINFLEQAKIKIQENDIKAKGLYLSKASRIVSELNNALDEKADKEVASNLERLYEFINLQIFEANLKNEISFIDNSIRVLKTLKEAWDLVSAGQLQKNSSVQERKDSVRMLTVTI